MPKPAPITLRPVLPADLEVFFEQQLDPQANYMAGFTAKDPADRAAFMAHWGKILADPGITIRTILFDGQVAGSVACHSWFGDPEISYWLGKSFWGRGIASAAVTEFLQIYPERPLFARAVADNRASLRVLEKNGFVRIGAERGFANARQAEVDEVILVLADTSGWQTYSAAGMPLSLKYPQPAPSGQPVEIHTFQDEAVERSHLLTKDSPEVYFEVTHYPGLAPEAEYQRHRRALEQRDLDEFEITPLLRFEFHLGAAFTYTFKWHQVTRTIILLPTGGGVCRVLYNPHSPLNLEILATLAYKPA